MSDLKKIYIAGSVQIHNAYAYGNTNEGEQVRKIVAYMKRELSKYKALFYYTSLDNEMDLNESAARANALGCTSYYAIHTNAGGGQGVTAIRQSSLLVPKARRDKSLIMATELCKAIEDMGRHNRGVTKRLNSWGGEYYSDLRQPKMASTILEIEFHDWYDGAKWIVGNTALIGRTLARRIAQIEGLELILKPYSGIYPTPVVSMTLGTTANVKLWQQYLCWYGADVKVDGLFGPDTYQKTVAFQKANGLVPDGSVGPLTISKAKTIRR